LPLFLPDPLSEKQAMAIRYSVDDANVAWRVTDGEAIVLHADSSAYFGLNHTGTILWAQLARQAMTIDQLAAWSEHHFTGTSATLRGEIATFIEQVQAGNLLRAEDLSDTHLPASDDANPGADETPSWEPPLAECFGELEKLILSGE
jgi:hypothetical protein